MVRLRIIEDYAYENNIPIMEKEGIDFLTNYIKEHNIKHILEIGSAIGYSAIKMALVDSNIKITTIERDEKRYKEALKNIKDFNLEDRINIILEDAFNVDLEESFDLIFIDAAKSQYIKFFEKFKKNLNLNGVIISDNLDFHGLVNGDYETYSRNVKGIVRKLKNYINFLKENEEFKTEFINIGDGIAITKRK
ncbi:MAG: O-methyltransferase [Firmicutes bacterium]|nr:O-methyltransferase [Bacillota bacterium]